MRRKARQASVDVLQQTVAGYMQGLGNHASGETRIFDRSLVDLSPNLNKATLLDSNEKQAVGGAFYLIAWRHEVCAKSYDSVTGIIMP